MVLDPGNMEGDQLFQIQGHLALTMWMLPYEVVGCFDEDESVLLEPLIASYLVRILLHSDLKTISNLSHASPFTVLQHLWCMYIGRMQIFSQCHEVSPYTHISHGC